jgi:hypothetical protein
VEEHRHGIYATDVNEEDRDLERLGTAVRGHHATESSVPVSESAVVFGEADRHAQRTLRLLRGVDEGFGPVETWRMNEAPPGLSQHGQGPPLPGGLLPARRLLSLVVSRGAPPFLRRVRRHPRPLGEAVGKWLD